MCLSTPGTGITQEMGALSTVLGVSPYLCLLGTSERDSKHMCRHGKTTALQL